MTETSNRNMPNLGSVDRLIRLAGGLVLLLLALVLLDGITALLAGAVGVVLLSTSVLSYCPLYGLVGFSTCKVAPGDRA